MIKIGSFDFNKPIGWLSILILSSILFKTMKNKIMIIFVIISMVLFRIISIMQPELYSVYDSLNTILYFLGGLIIFSISDRIFYKQILFIIILSAPIMFLQMAGVSWVQYHTYGQELAFSSGFTKTLFTSDHIILNHAQMRPSGIFWSNQQFGLLIIFMSAYLIFHHKRLKFSYYFLISFIVIISTSYYVILSYLIFLISIFIITNKHLKNRRLIIFTGFICANLLFKIVFPGVYSTLWDSSTLISKLWVRIADLQISGFDLTSLPFMSNIEIYNTLVQSSNRSELVNMFSSNHKAFTIFGILYKHKFISLVLILILIHLIFKFYQTSYPNDPLKYSKLFVLFGLLSFVSINPHGDLSLFSLLLSFPFTVYFPDFIKNHTTLNYKI